MVHVFVTGAAGYIGFATCVALRQRGHTVYGLVRKQEDAKNLEAQEVVPVIGDITDAKALDVIEKVAVVIDNVMNYADKPVFQSNRNLLAATLKAAQQAAEKGASSRKRYIYTSGCLVYGDYGGAVVDEATPLKYGGPRSLFEQEVLNANSKQLTATVIRPAWVYGGGQSRYTGGFFKGNAKDEIEIYGKPEKMWSWVHINDLVNAYALVAEAGHGVVGGELFDVSDDTRISYQDLFVLLARTNGVKGPVVHLPARSDYFSQLVESNNNIVSGQKLRQQLGWQPRMGVLQDNVQAWHLAMKASGRL